MSEICFWRVNCSFLAVLVSTLLALAPAWKYVQYQDTRVDQSGSNLWKKSDILFDDCQRKCGESSQCQCVLWRHSSNTCWGSRDCQARGFIHDADYNLSRKIPVPLGDLRDVHCTAHKNAFWKHGAEFDINWLKTPLGLSDAQCRSRCLEDRFCNCYVRNPDDGACYKRRDCSVGPIERDPVFTTCVLLRIPLVETEEHHTSTTTSTSTSTVSSTTLSTTSSTTQTTTTLPSSVNTSGVENNSTTSRSHGATSSTTITITLTTLTTLTTTSTTSLTTTLETTIPAAVPTTTTEESGPVLPLATNSGNVVRVKMIVDGLDFEQVMMRQHFRASFVNSIKHTISDGVCTGTVEGGHPGAISAGCIISPSHIDVLLLKGSVEVRANINCPGDMGDALASFVESSLISQPTLSGMVVSKVTDLCIDHSDDVCTGKVHASAIHILRDADVADVGAAGEDTSLAKFPALLGELAAYPPKLFWFVFIPVVVLVVSGIVIACMTSSVGVAKRLPSAAVVATSGDGDLLHENSFGVQGKTDGRTLSPARGGPKRSFFACCSRPKDEENEPLVSWWRGGRYADQAGFVKL